MNILGIDLGTNKAAYTHITGDISAPQYDSQLITTKETDVNERLVDMMCHLLDVIDKYNPELLVVEYPFNIQGHAKVLVELFGITRFHALKSKLPFLGLPQTKIKKYATGSGKAEKSDIRMQVYKEFGLDLGEDQSDSFFIAHFGMTYLYGSQKKFRQESVDDLKKSLEKSKKSKKKIKN